MPCRAVPCHAMPQVSFVFGLEVNWSLLQTRQAEREEAEGVLKEEQRVNLAELNAERRRRKSVLAGACEEDGPAFSEGPLKKTKGKKGAKAAKRPDAGSAGGGAGAARVRSPRGRPPAADRDSGGESERDSEGEEGSLKSFIVAESDSSDEEEMDFDTGSADGTPADGTPAIAKPSAPVAAAPATAGHAKPRRCVMSSDSEGEAEFDEMESSGQPSAAARPAPATAPATAPAPAPVTAPAPAPAEKPKHRPVGKRPVSDDGGLGAKRAKTIENSNSSSETSNVNLKSKPSASEPVSSKVPLQDVSNVLVAPPPQPPSQPSQGSLSQGSSGGGSGRAVLAEWHCALCTYLNSKRASKCSMCGSKK
jgi:hypothetical protein